MNVEKGGPHVSSYRTIGGGPLPPDFRHKTREFLERAEREGRAVWLGDDLPRSFILVGEGNAPPTVYISQLSTATLLRRMENNSFE